MKAYTCDRYGPPEVLKLAELPTPEPGDHEVLVEVRAVALNPLDWHYLTGTPYVMRLDSGMGRPKSDRLGVDFAGIVAAVGSSVTRFKPGDKVKLVVYGTRAPLRSFNPVWANLEVYADLARRSRQAARWRDKLAVWLMPPGWQPMPCSVRTRPH